MDCQPLVVSLGLREYWHEVRNSLDGKHIARRVAGSVHSIDELVAGERIVKRIPRSRSNFNGDELYLGNQR